MKTNPIQDKSPVHGDEFIILPEPRTAISICSKDIINVTISQSALAVFHNLSKVNLTSAARVRRANVAVCVSAAGILRGHHH